MTNPEHLAKAVPALPKPLLAPSVEQAKQVILATAPNWWRPAHACLSTIAGLRLEDIDLCPTCLLTGPSGSGKSSVGDWLEGAVGTVRVDSITPACFVSASSSSSSAVLQKQDILPQIQSKVMYTRDLSTIWSKNHDQQKALFGVLIPILDGKGYAPGSGTHGLRSVTGRYIFAWIAVTKSLPQQTWRIQKGFGSRTMHFDMFKPPNMTDEEIYLERQGAPFKRKMEECKKAIHTAVATIFLRRADGISKAAQFSVQWSTDSKDVSMWRIRLARLLVNCRQERGNIDEDDLDDPNRVITQLEVISRGSAMLEDRTVVTEEDLLDAVQLTLSSSRHGRGPREDGSVPETPPRSEDSETG